VKQVAEKVRLKKMVNENSGRISLATMPMIHQMITRLSDNNDEVGSTVSYPLGINKRHGFRRDNKTSLPVTGVPLNPSRVFSLA